MPPSTPGIHHITGISGPAQENLDFFVDVLGLRFVKKTVNFDDPGTYHLYYGDDGGRPGTILTFFPWPQAVQGRAGAGMPEATAFSVPEKALPFWLKRVSTTNGEVDGPFDRFGTAVLRLRAPDSLPLELVADPDAEAWPERGRTSVPAEKAIRGCFGLTLLVRDPEPTARLLIDVFGYTFEMEEGRRHRYQAQGSAPGRTIDLVEVQDHGRTGTGTIHHVAFRAADDDEQQEWQEALRNLGFNVTDVRDRQYFRSIYFREPNGILFEIATDGPGFAADESEDALGSALKLPDWLEARRSTIEERLPELHVPAL